VRHDAGPLDRDKRGVWVWYRACTKALASLGTLIGSPPQ
jgi:ArsR family transcriptional regulator